MIVLLLGAPGSGKGTISNYLINNYNYKQISTGDLLREEIASGSKLGKEFDEITKLGKFVSSDLVNSLVKNKINEYKKQNLNIILDGYPRNTEQADFLSTYCKIDMVAEISVSNELIIKRITGRWTCATCGTSFNVNTTQEYMPEVREDGYYCKKCGVKLFQRKDDNLETVKTRLETYDKQTLPLVNYYKKQGILHSFDGNKLKYNIIAEDIAKANK